MTDAKRTFVLADRLKTGPFESRQCFLDSLAKYEMEVLALTAAEIDSIVGRDPRRLHDYNRANWNLGVIDLRLCLVWPRMGSRHWATGTPVSVAEMFKAHEPGDSRVWGMKLFAGIFASRLPIIILKTDSEVRIDDGSHRAIAMALAGLTQVSAWIGCLP